jgi:hypothetical protein
MSYDFTIATDLAVQFPSWSPSKDSGSRHILHYHKPMRHVWEHLKSERRSIPHHQITSIIPLFTCHFWQQ